MNPFHGLPPSLLLMPAFAVILIVMAWGRPKHKPDQTGKVHKLPHPADVNERNWFHGQDRNKAA